jgi:hypothetical protein
MDTKSLFHTSPSVMTKMPISALHEPGALMLDLGTLQGKLSPDINSNSGDPP